MTWSWELTYSEPSLSSFSFSGYLLTLIVSIWRKLKREEADEFLHILVSVNAVVQIKIKT